MVQVETPDRVLVEGKTGARALGYRDHAILNRHGFVEQRRAPGHVFDRDAIGFSTGDAEAVLGENVGRNRDIPALPPGRRA